LRGRPFVLWVFPREKGFEATLRARYSCTRLIAHCTDMPLLSSWLSLYAKRLQALRSNLAVNKSAQNEADIFAEKLQCLFYFVQR
jgi:hypothetical protein